MGNYETDPTDKQERAIELLVAGSTVVDVATELGITRRTIHRWQAEDAGFQAGLNRARQQRRQAHVCQLEALVEQAIGNVKQAIQDGDLKTSLAVLRNIGALDREPIGPTDPQAIEDQRARAEADSKLARREAEIDSWLA